MLRTDDDEALLDAERTSTIVMVIILVGLMFLPDAFFGCGEQRRGELVDRPIVSDTPAAKREPLPDFAVLTDEQVVSELRHTSVAPR